MLTKNLKLLNLLPKNFLVPVRRPRSPRENVLPHLKSWNRFCKRPIAPLMYLPNVVMGYRCNRRFPMKLPAFNVKPQILKVIICCFLLCEVCVALGVHVR